MAIDFIVQSADSPIFDLTSRLYTSESDEGPSSILTDTFLFLERIEIVLQAVNLWRFLEIRYPSLDKVKIAKSHTFLESEPDGITELGLFQIQNRT